MYMYMTMHLKSNYLKICFLNVQANNFLKHILWENKINPWYAEIFKVSKSFWHVLVSYEILISNFQTPSTRLWCLAKHLMFIWMTKLWFLNKLYLQNLKSLIQFCWAFKRNEKIKMTSYDLFPSITYTYYTVQGPGQTQLLRTDRARRETSFGRMVTTNSGITQVRARAFVLDVVW